VKSNGEFGSVLRWIFQPESATQFGWEGGACARTLVHVFSYRIDQAHSKYGMRFSTFQHYSTTSGMRGLVLSTAKPSGPEARDEADSIPANFPVWRTSRAVWIRLRRSGRQAVPAAAACGSAVWVRDTQAGRMDISGITANFSSETTVTFEK